MIKAIITQQDPSTLARLNNIISRQAWQRTKQARLMRLKIIRRKIADLVLFEKFLQSASVPAIGLYDNPQSWRGITWGIVKAFRNWMLQQGYAIGSINGRLSTVRTYAKIAARVGAISPEESILVASVQGYASNEQAQMGTMRQRVTEINNGLDTVCRLSQPIAPHLGGFLGVVRNLADDTEVVNIRSQRAIGEESNMDILVYLEVVSGPLTDDSEIVHKSKLRTNLGIEGPLRLTYCIVLVASDQPCAAHSLWLEVELAMDPAIVVNYVDEQNMKCPREMNQFARSQRRAGDEHQQIERLRKVIGDRCGFCLSLCHP